MKISYIAPVSVTMGNGVVDSGVIERAISSAIEKTIVIPFQKWMLDSWIKFVDASFVICLAIAITGYILGICGLNKGYKLSVFSIVFYLLIRLISYCNGWY